MYFLWFSDDFPIETSMAAEVWRTSRGWPHAGADERAPSRGGGASCLGFPCAMGQVTVFFFFFKWDFWDVSWWIIGKWWLNQQKNQIFLIGFNGISGIFGIDLPSGKLR